MVGQITSLSALWNIG